MRPERTSASAEAGEMYRGFLDITGRRRGTKMRLKEGALALSGRVEVGGPGMRAGTSLGIRIGVLRHPGPDTLWALWQH